MTQQTLDQETFLNDVLDGLSAEEKHLSSKYFYDERGSKLFDEICELDEYYLTRTELQILRDNADSIANQVESDVMLVEPGSGSSVKTAILLDSLIDPVAYVPVDISEDHLLKTAMELRVNHPEIEILPVAADFTKPYQLPSPQRPYSHVALFFPGSTIGNFQTEQADELLRQLAEMLGKDGGLLIGIDLQKDPAKIEAAYNDSAGITAAFNLNLLLRIQNELGGEVDIDSLTHRAVYNRQLHRIETSLVSEKEQTVSIDQHTFEFSKGEPVRTEYSYKYTIDGFSKIAAKHGFVLHEEWTDQEDLFAVIYLVLEE